MAFTASDATYDSRHHRARLDRRAVPNAESIADAIGVAPASAKLTGTAVLVGKLYVTEPASVVTSTAAVTTAAAADASNDPNPLLKTPSRMLTLIWTLLRQHLPPRHLSRFVKQSAFHFFFLSFNFFYFSSLVLLQII